MRDKYCAAIRDEGLTLTVLREISDNTHTTLRQADDIDLRIRRENFREDFFKHVRDVILPALVAGDLVPESHLQGRINSILLRDSIPT